MLRFRKARRAGPLLRAGLSSLLLALLAACASTYQGGGTFRARNGNYAPPGPAEDPWGPYISEASSRYRVPEPWIRAVMRQESGGREYLNGQPITSGAGAMGLMQVMPATYDMLANRYGLGSDPYDPHDNIMAGTAYIHELYQQFGSPGFLAAYNAGPGRLSSHLAGGGPLPSETVRYVASIAPRLGGDRPARSDASDGVQYAAYQPRAAAPVIIASAANPNGSGRTLAQEAAWQTGGQATPAVPTFTTAQEAAWQTSPDQYAGSAPAPAPEPAPAPVMVASAAPPPLPVAPPEPRVTRSALAVVPPAAPVIAPSPPRSFMVAEARAGELPPALRYRPVSQPMPMPPPPPGPGLLGTIPISRHGVPEPPLPPRIQLASASAGSARLFGGRGTWMIQVGAYDTPALARTMAENARRAAPEALRGADSMVRPVATGAGGTLYRARFTGLSEGSAATACGQLHESRISCATLPPDERW